MFFSFPLHLQGEQLQYADVPLPSDYSHFASVFCSSITKGRWTLKAPWSSLLEGAIMLVPACGSQLRDYSVKVSLEGVFINWGWPAIWVYNHMPICPPIHTCTYNLLFPCGFPLEHEMQDTGSSWAAQGVGRAYYGGSWQHTTQQRAAMPNSQF